MPQIFRKPSAFHICPNHALKERDASSENYVKLSKGEIINLISRG
jgi:hypothetical protein